MSFIDHSIKLDFKIPRDIQRVMDECDELSRKEHYGYFNLAEYLTDTLCKEAYVQKHLTREQWELIEMKYHQ